MKSIKFKLIVYTTAMTLAAILFVAVPSLNSQIAEVKHSITKISAEQMKSAGIAIEAFLNTPSRMVIVDALNTMNDNTSEVRSASHEMSEGNRTILTEIQNLQTATGVIKDGMTEMTIGAEEMNKTSGHLSEISGKVNDSINRIGMQIDQFKV